VTDTSDKILNDITTYLRVTAASVSRENAARVIDSAEKAAVYAKLDGNTSQGKLEQVTGVPNQTLSHWLPEFVLGGIASPPNEYYRSHRALFTLQELGINPSDLKKRVKPSSKNASPTQPGTLLPQSQDVS